MCLRGMALPVVLWMVAALSILLGNLVQFSRVEVQMASVQLARAQAEATSAGVVAYVAHSLGEGMQLMQSPPVRRALSVEDNQIAYELVNAAGLIDLSYADDGLLTLLLQTVLNWSTERTQEAIDTRKKLPAPAFQTLGDARRTLAVGYSDWLKLAPFVTVYSGLSGVNVLVAPLGVLHILRPGNIRAVEAFDQARQLSKGLPDTTLINTPYHQQATVGVFRLDVNVNLPDGRSTAHRYWLTRANRPPAGWRVSDHQPLPDQ